MHIFNNTSMNYRMLLSAKDMVTEKLGCIVIVKKITI